MAKTITLADDVADVLRRATVDGDTVTLPTGQLDRKLYVAVDAALRALGGRWHRHRRCHLFPDPVGDRLAEILDEGEVTPPQAFGFFPTPAPLVQRMLDMAAIKPGHRVLEPSAGRGAIAHAIRQRHPDVGELALIELLDDNVEALRKDGFKPVVAGDFLTLDPDPIFDRVVMNPPFERKQDVRHVMHAYRLLRPGGRLVAVLSAGVLSNADRQTVAFRRLLLEDRGAYVERNDRGAFRESGTMVATITMQVDAPWA